MEFLYILQVFAIVHLLAAASPGPNLVLVSSHAVTHSRGSALLLGIGIVLGTFVWSSSVAMGLGVLIQHSPALYTLIQYAGAIYLVWLGIGMLRDGINNRYAINTKKVTETGNAYSYVLKGFAVNMTNPKSIAYWTSLFTVLIPADSPSWLFAAAIAITVTVSLTWWFLVAMFFSAGRVRSGFLTVRRYIDLFTGAALILLGLRLATAK